MKYFVLTICLSAILSVPESYAEVVIRPIATGDIVTRQYYNLKQLGREPIVFEEGNKRTYKMRIEADGDRKFLDVEDDSLVFINDKDYVTVFTKGKPIPENYRFVRLPNDRPLRPDMEWDVPTYQLDTWSVGRLTAKSAIGPTVAVLLDSSKTPVETIQISYEGWIYVHGGYRRRISIESLFSSQLNEFVRHQIINWHWDGDGKTFLFFGSRYDLRSIQYSSTGDNSTNQ